MELNIKQIQKYDNIFGIDPDSKKSGIAFYQKLTGKYQVDIGKFFEIFKTLNSYKTQNTLVIIEAGWLNKSNWHVNKSQSNAVSGLIGNKTGLNHQTGILIEQMCQYLNVEYKLVRPTTSKWNAETCKNLTKVEMKHIPTESKQDCRDALKLIFH
jgi:hypothetical protein